MKQLTSTFSFRSFMTICMLAIMQTALWAQEGTSEGSSSGSSSSTTTKTVSVTSDANGWYTSPWVWVVGAAVFILLLVALMRGGSNGASTTATHTDRVTVTKSSSTDV